MSYKKHAKDTKGERSIAALLDTYGDEVSQIKQKCVAKGLPLEPDVHDAIFFLRYLLSWGIVDASVKAVEDTFAYMEANREWFPKRGAQLQDFQHYDILSKHFARGMHKETKQGDLVNIVRPGARMICPCCRNCHHLQHGVEQFQKQHSISCPCVSEPPPA